MASAAIGLAGKVVACWMIPQGFASLGEVPLQVMQTDSLVKEDFDSPLRTFTVEFHGGVKYVRLKSSKTLREHIQIKVDREKRISPLSDTRIARRAMETPSIHEHMKTKKRQRQRTPVDADRHEQDAEPSPKSSTNNALVPFQNQEDRDRHSSDARDDSEPEVRPRRKSRSKQNRHNGQSDPNPNPRPIRRARMPPTLPAELLIIPSSANAQVMCSRLRQLTYRSIHDDPTTGASKQVLVLEMQAINWWIEKSPDADAYYRASNNNPGWNCGVPCMICASNIHTTLSDQQKFPFRRNNPGFKHHVSFTQFVKHFRSHHQHEMVKARVLHHMIKNITWLGKRIL